MLSIILLENQIKKLIEYKYPLPIYNRITHINNKYKYIIVIEVYKSNTNI